MRDFEVRGTEATKGRRSVRISRKLTSETGVAGPARTEEREPKANVFQLVFLFKMLL